MELVAVHLARIVAFLEIFSLDPKGRTTASEGISSFGERYAFKKVPQSVAEMDFQKGVQFNDGRFNDLAIDQIQLYGNGILIDTRSSTDNSLLILEDLLEYARTINNANVQVVRKHFLSQLVFHSTLSMGLLNPILEPIAKRLGEKVSKTLNHPITFGPTAIRIGPDVSQLKLIPSAFSIERRDDYPFSENTYYSTAPLSTTEHLELIEEVERALR
jgi:hypothetical protein